MALKLHKIVARGYVLQRDNKSFIITQSTINHKYCLFIDGEYWSTHDTYEECWNEVLFDEFLERQNRKNKK